MLMIIGTLVLLELMYKRCTGWFLTDEQVLRSLSSARLDDTTSVSNYIDMSEPCLFMRIRHLTVVLWLRYIPIKSVQYESRSHSWSKNRYFAWECWTSLRRDWSNWKVSKLNDPIHNMSYIVPKQKKIFCMIGLPWSQEGLCYRRDRNFFHSSNSLQLGGRLPPVLKFNWGG